MEVFFNVLVFSFCFIVMLLGLAGTVLPVLPGIPIIWVAILGYGWYGGWTSYGFTAMLITGILSVLSIIVDQLASVLGTKKFGGSTAGMIGSVVGAILGAIFFNVFGLIAGTFLGAVVGELAFNGSDFKQSMNSGLGSLVGFLAGSLFKFMLGCGLIAYFLLALIF